MKTSSLGVALLASVAIGCSDSSGPGSATPADLVGQWTASAYTVTSVANTSTSAELVAMGLTITITFTETTYTGVVIFPGDPTDDFSGTYTIDGLTLTLNETGKGSPETMTYVLLGSTLTLNGDDVHDFLDNGQEEAVTFVMVLDKQ